MSNLMSTVLLLKVALCIQNFNIYNMNEMSRQGKKGEKLKKGKEDPNAVRTVGKDMGTNVRRALLKKLITKKKKQKQANIQQAK